VAAPTIERRRDDFVRLCHRGLDIADCFAEAGRLLGEVAPYDGCCWLTLDPATFLATSHITENSIREGDVAALARNEYEEEDVSKFAELARGQEAGILSLATGGRRESSPRYRNILRPNGYEDELRTAFVEEGAAWGAAALYRHPDSADFEQPEAEFVASVGPYIAEALRRAILISSVSSKSAPNAAGLILLNEDDSVDSITAVAERWMSDVAASAAQDAGELPDIIYGVASRARRIGRGETGGELARARVRTGSGHWLVLHGSLLDAGRTAIILEPARPPEIAPLIAEAYGLSQRERDVTQLVLQGLSTGEIAKALFLSPYTVQDHLKAIFDKVGVRSRRALVAQVFFEHYAPRLGAGDNLASDGWFAR
jgi:DNA-binding CsgD family transcriptional regulator